MKPKGFTLALQATDRRVEGGRRNGWLGGFAKVDNRFGYEKWT